MSGHKVLEVNFGKCYSRCLHSFYFLFWCVNKCLCIRSIRYNHDVKWRECQVMTQGCLHMCFPFFSEMANLLLMSTRERKTRLSAFWKSESILCSLSHIKCWWECRLMVYRESCWKERCMAIHAALLSLNKTLWECDLIGSTVGAYNHCTSLSAELW